MLHRQEAKSHSPNISEEDCKLKTKYKLLIIALATAVSGSFVAIAADDQPVPAAKSAEKKSTANKPKRHDHNAENKASAPGQPADSASGPVKPAHDHRKENKGGG